MIDFRTVLRALAFTFMALFAAMHVPASEIPDGYGVGIAAEKDEATARANAAAFVDLKRKTTELFPEWGWPWRWLRALKRRSHVYDRLPGIFSTYRCHMTNEERYIPPDGGAEMQIISATCDWLTSFAEMEKAMEWWLAWRKRVKVEAAALLMWNALCLWVSVHWRLRYDLTTAGRATARSGLIMGIMYAVSIIGGMILFYIT